MLTLEYYRFAKTSTETSKYKEFSREDRSRITEELNIANNCLVDILSFVLMPNHFHFSAKAESRWWGFKIY